MSNPAQLSEYFEGERSRLNAVAYRLLGSRTDAEDAVQETWLRLAGQDAGSIENLRGWLTTVVSRIGIDMLRARAARHETSMDRDPSDAIVTDVVVTADRDSPEDTAVLADNVGVALLMVLQSLRPDERLAFILHDTFAVPFADIAPILGKTPDATKMLASRARRKVRHHERHDGNLQEQREIVDAFLAAAHDGDFDDLVRLLDPDVTWHRVTAHGTTTQVGESHVTDAVRRGQSSRVSAHRVLVNGEPGIMSWGPTGKPLSVMACTVRHGCIVEIVSIIDPARLGELDLSDVGPDGRDNNRS
ncbi:sigma-70 family RNA polymerase sigma factor [Gordonia zhaorongruii]|uniref:sigma-70 family RNA polymerase sigma factor n=1 Tax=Gordonia zhaorongruii TaxID=2597659 RepID=UPI001042B842|nr:sigma-70 family RNA polymerase sigma factor [Gordonia zhaorongruii]